jgi:hypothetical protein
MPAAVSLRSIVVEPADVELDLTVAPSPAAPASSPQDSQDSAEVPLHSDDASGASDDGDRPASSATVHRAMAFTGLTLVALALVAVIAVGVLRRPASDRHVILLCA